MTYRKSGRPLNEAPREERVARVGRRSALALVAQMATMWPLGARGATGIRVAEQPFDASLEASYAQAQGFAAQVGLDVEIVMLPSNGAANVAAMVGNSVDIAISNTFSALRAADRGVPLTVIAPAALYTSKAPSTFLMVAKSTEIRRASDLDGKMVAVNGLGNVAQYASMAWVDKNGGDSGSLHFVEMPLSDMPVALISHRVDAAVIAEPLASQSSDLRRLAPVFDGIGSEFLLSVWVATKSWAAAHDATARAFLTMVYRTAAWANRNHDATAPTLARATGIEPAGLKQLVRATFATQYEPALIQSVVDVTLRYGGIAKAPRLDDLLSSAMLGRG